MWSIKCGMEVGWALGGLGNQSHPPPVPEAKGAEDVGGAAALPARGTGGINIVSENHFELSSKPAEEL